MILMEQYADLGAAREFAAVFMSQIDEDFPRQLALRLVLRRDRIRSLVDSGLGRGGALEEILSLFFGVRRRAGEIVATCDREDLAASIEAIAAGSILFGGIPQTAMADSRLARSLALEVAHSMHPGEVPLWTDWVWDPEAETGALKLLVEEEVDLFGQTDDEVLAKVREVSTYLRYTFDAAGLPVDQGDPFSLDVFLSGVYAVYSRTMLQLRLTKEFNRLLPDTQEFMARLLGFRKEG